MQGWCSSSNNNLCQGLRAPLWQGGKNYEKPISSLVISIFSHYNHIWFAPCIEVMLIQFLILNWKQPYKLNFLSMFPQECLVLSKLGSWYWAFILEWGPLMRCSWDTCTWLGSHGNHPRCRLNKKNWNHETDKDQYEKCQCSAII